MPHVIIVGAGIAGAGAAAVFRQSGWRVTVLDKASKPGGRCATRRTAADPASPWFDYGAQYFTARDPEFRAVVERDLAHAKLRRWQPAIQLAEQQDGRWRLTASPDERERLIAPTGLSHWVRHRLDESGAEVQCATPVRAVARDVDGWRVQAENHSAALCADALVVTTPAPQAAALLGTRALEINELAQADDALRACHSLVVEAPALAHCHGLFVNKGLLSWCADNSHKAGRNDAARHLWTLHAGPDFSDAHVEDSADAVQPALRAEFAAITGFAAADIVPLRGHRWRYARPGDGAPQPARLCYSDCRQGLALAGDWLAGGRVEGAWRSGCAAAQALTGESRR